MCNERFKMNIWMDYSRKIEHQTLYQVSRFLARGRGVARIFLWRGGGILNFMNLLPLKL